MVIFEDVKLYVLEINVKWIENLQGRTNRRIHLGLLYPSVYLKLWICIRPCVCVWERILGHVHLLSLFSFVVYLKILQQILSPSPINWHRNILLSLFSFIFRHISTLVPSASLSQPPPSLPVPPAMSVSNQTGKIILHTVALWIRAARCTPSVTRTLEKMYFHGRFNVISETAGPTNRQLPSVL